ncbi:MAG: glycosyltransferase [Planctomycetota bacterium]
MTTFSTSHISIVGEGASVRGEPLRRFDPADFVFKVAIVAVSAAIVVIAFTSHAREEAFQLLWQHRVGRPFLILGMAYGGLTTVWSAWRFVLAIRYRPTPCVSTGDLPRITVVVPVFNEGAMIAETLRHLSMADYPPERMEVIVVDDGSTDETWSHVERAAGMWDRFSTGRRIEAIRLPTNRGKRHALYEGFRRASGDILITVDSDSFVARDALRELVSPLVRDAGVGAVAGNVRVLNKSGGLIPRMLDIRYVMTFDYKRAAQSVMSGGSVLCVAGALAAYRRAAVEPVMEEWLHQEWLGQPARAGEDHAMTNFVLRQGYVVKFQRTAHVRTQSPTTYGGLARMFLRWGRSNVRETAHLARFVFKPRSRCYALRFNFLIGATGLFVPYFFLAAAFVLSFAWPMVFGLKLLAACVVGGVFPLFFTAARERDDEALLAIPYSFYAILLLCWVWPYALFTSHKSVWMTRSAS